MEVARNLNLVTDSDIKNLSSINRKIEDGVLPSHEFSEVVKITPEDAENILVNRIHPNRAISSNRAKACAMQLKNGKWRLNGEPLVFGRVVEGADVRSILLDGRHRLTACQMTGIPFVSFVSFNVDPKHFDTLDQGKARSTGDILSVKAVRNARDVATALKRLFLFNEKKMEIYQNNNGLAVIPSNDLVDHYYKHEKLEDSVQKCLLMKRAKMGLVPQMSVLHYHVAQNMGFKDKADFFVETTAMGDNLKRTSPQFQLREFMRVTDSRTKDTKKYTQEARQKALIIAWNYFLRGREMKISLESILKTAMREDQDIKIIRDKNHVKK